MEEGSVNQQYFQNFSGAVVGKKTMYSVTVVSVHEQKRISIDTGISCSLMNKI